MLKLYITLQSLLGERRDRGATAVEYALIIAGVAAVLAVAVFALEGVLTEMFNETCEQVSGDNITTTC